LDCPVEHLNDSESDSSDDLPPVFRNPVPTQLSSQGQSSSTTQLSYQGQSSSSQCGSSRQVIIEDLFPDLTPEQVKTCLETDTLEAAADMAAGLIEGVHTSTPSTSSTPSTDFVDATKQEDEIECLFQLFQFLKRNLKSEKKLLIVNEECVLEDAFVYYKAKDFDPRFPLKIRFSNQPGIDAGGLLRHFYTLLYNELSSPFQSSLFEGVKGRMLPVCRSETILNDIFVYIGKVFAHSICQGVSPLKLARPALMYILHDSISEAAVHCTIQDVASEIVKHFIEEVLRIFVCFSYNK